MRQRRVFGHNLGPVCTFLTLLRLEACELTPDLTKLLIVRNRRF
jgi:hypothetical protein